MNSAKALNPFLDGPPAEVPLPRAPLARVIAQVRFPKVLVIGTPGGVAQFQEKIRAKYPNVVEERLHAIPFPSGHVEARVETIWRFVEIENNWRISLGTDFVALETRAYTSRNDFINRLVAVVDALAETIDPKISSRIGVRYVSRILDAEYAALPKLLHAPFHGAGDVPAFLQAHSVLVSEGVFKSKEGEVRVRWGYLPNNAVHEPDLLDPVDKPSWICDIDSSIEGRAPFNSKELRPQALALAERCYAVFRGMVTDEFLITYGGKL